MTSGVASVVWSYAGVRGESLATTCASYSVRAAGSGAAAHVGASVVSGPCLCDSCGLVRLRRFEFVLGLCGGLWRIGALLVLRWLVGLGVYDE